MKNLYGLLDLSRRPGKLSDDPLVGKYDLERRVELERLRDAADTAYIGIKSCFLVIFLMKYLYGLFQHSRVPGEVSDHTRAGKSNLERRVELERLRERAGHAYIGIKSCFPMIVLVEYIGAVRALWAS